MKCLVCENIYPPHYDKCPICDGHLVREQFKKQEVEVEEVEQISALVVDGDLEIGVFD